MPATYTHNRFAKDIYSNLDENLQKELKNNYTELMLFAQSFDNLYFYNFYFHKGKKYRKLGNYAHKNNVNDYFKNIITYILKQKEIKPEYKAYLYGSLAHYILDKNMHPYVFYKTGTFFPRKVETHKYNGLHTKFEFMLDAIFYNYDYKISYKKNNIVKEKFPKIIFSTDLKNIIDYSFKETFNEKNIGKIFNKSYLDYRLALKYIYQDKSGLKKNLLKVFDKLTGKKIQNMQWHSMHIVSLDYSILNIERKKWIYPANKNKSSNKSVIDIYDDSLKEILKIISNIELLFQNKYTLKEILTEIGNKSYTTGLDCDLRSKMTTFEF